MQLAGMSLLALINETFPQNRQPDGAVVVWTRGGGVLTGRVRHCDNRGLVLDTAGGAVLVIPRSIIAIAQNRDAIGPVPSAAE